MSENEAPKKKRGCLGCLGKLFLASVVLVIVLVVAVGLFLPGVIKSNAETIGTQMLGTPVTIQSVDLSILGGSAEFKGISIANYEGFSEKEMLSIGSAGGDISVLSLLGGNIVVDRVWATKPVLNLEVDRKGRQNLNVLLESLPKDQQTTDTMTQEPQPTGPVATPPVTIKEVSVTDIALNFVDDYASDKKLTAGLAVASFGLEDIALPSLDDKNATSVMTTTVGGFTMKAPDHFKRPLIVDSKETKVRMDLGKLVATLSSNEKIIDVVDVTNDATAIVTETLVANEYDPTPQNVREFLVIAMNCSVPGQVRTFAELDEEARKANEAAAKTAQEQPPLTLQNVWEAITTTQEQVEVASASTPAETTEPVSPGYQFLLGTVTVTNFTLDNINEAAPEQNVQILSTDVDFKSFAWPHQKGLISDIAVRTHLLDKEGRVSVKVRGELMAALEGKRVDVAADIVNQQIAGLPTVQQGRLFSTLKLAVENKRALGELTFNTVDFKFAPDAPVKRSGSVLGDIGGTFASIGQTVGKKTVEASLAAQQKSGAPPFVVPIDYNIETFSVADIIKGLLASITRNVGGPLESGLQEFMKLGGQITEQINTEAITGELNKATESLGEAGNTAKEALGGVGEEAEKATKEVEGAIQGLFGKKKKSE